MSLMQMSILATKLAHTSNTGAVYGFYILALVCLFYSFSKIKAIDLKERENGEHKSIFLGKMKKLFVTDAKEKDYMPKKTLILELIGYGCFLVTAVLASISWLLEVYFVSAFSWLWFLLVIIYTAVVSRIHVKMIKPSNMIDF